MEKKSLYEYITENIDPEEQCFTQETLLDDPHPTVPHPLGAEDAFWFTSDSPPYERGAEEILKALDEYLQYPDQPHKQKLYKLLSDAPVIAVAEILCDKLNDREITDKYFYLARSFFYNAQHRGPIKFAYMLFGFYGMENIKDNDADLWEDLIKIAQCEEFTYFFLFACRISNLDIHKEIWRLIGCCKGWGRVFAIEEAKCEDEAQELWLIQHGLEIEVEHPPLAAHILEVANLPYHLEQEEISYRTFKGAAIIVNQFLILLNNYDENVLEANLNTATVKPVQLIQNLIRHAKQHATKPEDILQIVNLHYGLNNLLQNEDLAIIESNTLQVLMADCDSIIYAQDWQHYIENNLIDSDEVNFDLCDFACELDMDIWKPLFDYFCEHPFNYKVMPYLFSYNDESYQKMALHAVEHNLNLYRTEEAALLVPLRYLAHNPGMGEQIIIAALTSLYDWPRGIACSALHEWGQEYLTPPLKNALKNALTLSNNPVVTARIEALLIGKDFSINDVIN